MDVTLADIQKMLPDVTLIQLTDDTNAGAIVEAKVTQAITDAYAEAWPYVGVKYSVPIATPEPAILQKIVVDIAIYNLYARKVEEIPETRSERYKNAIRQLEGISKGTISLGIDPPPAAPTAGAPETNVATSPRVFTRETLKGF
jgi:phage gp36-like protein